ncbi:MAG: hypothetical protein PHE25_03520 [Candidatus Gracilibacteria bacterium]|nr:hypothetical protein [Candidatus Gracilibacteria bacterium]
MKLRNKILAVLVIAISTLNLAFADINKDDLLSQISSLETKLTQLKTNSTSDLETKALSLSQSFDSSINALGYDSKTIAYLVSLGKITSNFKNDLTIELNSLNKEISDKTLIEINSLSAIKNNLNLNYTTVSDSQKATLLESINSIQSDYENLASSFSGEINTLNNKYSSSLSNYISTIKSVYNSNTGSINILNSFESKFNSLYKLNSDFEKNYTSFKDSYLSYAGELSVFSTEKQAFYVSALKKELEKIRDLNIDANKGLADYTSDINRLIDILLENFANSLKINIDNSYGVVYSSNDVNSIISRYTTLKNRYFDLDGKIKAPEVIANSQSATDEINFLNQGLSDVNLKIIDLVGTGTSSSENTLSNVKIRLENQMVNFYNSNYNGYRQDLLSKLQEKLNIISLDAKNIILASDSIDLRYSLLNDKISVSNDINFINTQISNFKQDIAKYNYLNNSIITNKLSNINNNLGIFAVKKELGLFKYNKMSQTKYDSQLAKIFALIKAKYPDNYKTKLDTVLTKIDNLLNNSKLSDKNRFMLLVVKLNILNYIK